jgi:cysteine desulfurase
MQRIYFDNAATTAIDPLVLEAMMPYFTEKFGNPSSIYSYGRETKMAIENARKSVAKHIGAKPAEVFFTSGGTESSNTAIMGAVNDLGCKYIITSSMEHHATLYTVQAIAAKNNLQIGYVHVLPNGELDLEHLQQLLQQSTEKTLVTLMHGNNEIGTILPIEKVGKLCQEFGAIFHTDAVQTIAHYPLDVATIHVHLLSGAGHKFHGPKGVGLLYINENIKISSLLLGGGQERNMRSGTENLYGIVGFATALDLAMQRYEKDSAYIQSIKNYMWQQLQKAVPTIVLHGKLQDSLYTVLNVGFVNTPKAEMLLYRLDMEGICISGGSACSSGANSVSHVIKAIANGSDVIPIRFSFSRNNTMQEVDVVIEKIKAVLEK